MLAQEYVYQYDNPAYTGLSWGLALAGVGLSIFVLVDAIRRPDWVWPATGQSKSLWITLGVLGIFPGCCCGLAGIAIGVTYLAAIRSKLEAAGSGGPYGGPGYGPPPGAFGQAPPPGPGYGPPPGQQGYGPPPGQGYGPPPAQPGYGPPPAQPGYGPPPGQGYGPPPGQPGYGPPPGFGPAPGSPGSGSVPPPGGPVASPPPPSDGPAGPGWPPPPP